MKQWKKKMSNICLYMLGILFFLAPSGVFAQSGGLILEHDPPIPLLGDIVESTLQSSNIDLKRSTITWYVNDEMRLQDVGAVDFQFETTGLGTNDILEVFVTDPNGRKYSERKVFPIHDLDLIWAGHTYTPPFYKGLPLVTPQSVVKISAIPHISSNGSFFDATDLNFTWSIDGIVLGNFSGIGKDTIALNGNNFPRGLTKVNVQVATRDSSQSISKQIAVETVSPQVILYAVDPLTGINFNEPIGSSLLLTGSEVTVSAAPFYYSVDDIEESNIWYRWSVDRQAAAPNQFNPREITFRKDPNKDSGTVRIDLEVENRIKVLQYVRRVFRLNI